MQPINIFIGCINTETLVDIYGHVGFAEEGTKMLSDFLETLQTICIGMLILSVTIQPQSWQEMVVGKENQTKPCKGHPGYAGHFFEQ